MKNNCRERLVFVLVIPMALLMVMGMHAEDAKPPTAAPPKPADKKDWPNKEYLSGKVWPKVPVITPGEGTAPPSDAIVLFDGKDLSQWNGGDKWIVADGVATVKDTNITSKQSFGDCQIHVEWASPEKVSGKGQGRGNSGIYIQTRYEIQVLDSVDNETYPDGQAGSVYKQNPPLVNASRGPGQWQAYDIIFTAPRFEEDGKLKSPAYVTVIHNGVLVQNHFELPGGTFWNQPPEYNAHPLKQPLLLQNHGNPVRYRNIWIREL
jgi:hypothetical protein